MSHALPECAGRTVSFSDHKRSVSDEFCLFMRAITKGLVAGLSAATEIGRLALVGGKAAVRIVNTEVSLDF
jgi:hypothetical protein